MKRFLLFLMLVLCAASAQAATQFDFLLSQVRTSTTALIGGKVYFYSPGTTTPKTVWLDRYQGTPAGNPYTLDANGTAQLYGSGGYRVVIKDAAGVTRFDRDGVMSVGDDGTMNAVDATAGNQTFSLPSGGTAIVAKMDATANTVTIQPSVGGQTINGLTTYVLYGQGESVRLSLSGSTWYAQ
jgi:hypothetical protein